MKHQAKVQLVKYLSNDSGENKALEYSVEHNNGNTSLEQRLILREFNQGLHSTWSAKINLDEFPLQSSPKNAAIKLAEWLERLAIAIRVGDFQEIQTAKFVEVEDAGL